MKNLEGIKKHNKQKTADAVQKVEEAIRILRTNGQNINFSSVSKESKISKSFLYDNKNIKKEIEQLRTLEVNKKINQRAKFDKTAKAKDIIIATKDKKIARLEEEIRILKIQINNLQVELYNKI